jgi:hypothetical protein
MRPRLSSGRAWFRADAALVWGVAVAAALVGVRAAWLYHEAGLTLIHYDAKAHLVVARRVFDNLTPGWRQLGAVWLPLPHLLNLLPVQIDACYRTGACAVVMSIGAFALAASAVARIVLRATGSTLAALAAATVLTLNPDLLYLQSTPMTEALLVCFLAWSASFTWDWLEEPTARHRRRAGWTLAAACLTRYEAWPVTGALLVASQWVLSLREGAQATSTPGDTSPGERLAARRPAPGGRAARPRLPCAVREVLRLSAYPAIAVAAFLLQSRLTVGDWFVTGGFFKPDNIDTGNPARAVASIWWGAHVIAGHGVEWAATAGLIGAIVAARRNVRRRSLVALAALLATGALPAYAFYDGHPFRIRYMTPLVPGLAVGAGLGLGLLRARWRPLAALALVTTMLVEARPFRFDTPMVREAQWDSGNMAARRQVTRCLAAHRDGRPILASMASLAHYMQETSTAGFNLRDFLHEGNGGLWKAALASPGRHVGWILMEEWAEGGDQLATRAREHPAFLRGFERVAEGGGVALYRNTGK